MFIITKIFRPFFTIILKYELIKKFGQGLIVNKCIAAAKTGFKREFKKKRPAQMILIIWVEKFVQKNSRTMKQKSS